MASSPIALLSAATWVHQSSSVRPFCRALTSNSFVSQMMLNVVVNVMAAEHMVWKQYQSYDREEALFFRDYMIFNNLTMNAQ